LKIAPLLAFSLFALTAAGTLQLVRRPGSKSPVPRAGLIAFTARMQEASALFRSGRYQESLGKYQLIREDCHKQGNLDQEARATANIGGCQFALHQYQPALRSFQEARTMALAAGDTGVAAVFEGNIASLYTELGNLDAAAQWMQESLARVSGRDRADHLAKLQVQMATILARQKKSGAWEYFEQGMEGADRAGDLELYTFAWNRIGEELLKKADPEDDEAPALDPATRQAVLDRAETALVEAYRIRKLHRLRLENSYRNLGRLRLAQGDLASAATLLDRALELVERPQGLMPTWDIYYRRGLVRLRQGRLRGALADLRVALKLGRAWRWSAPPDPAARIGTEQWLNKVYAALIEAGNRLYLETGDQALLRETFEAAEENRAASLRALAGRTDPEFLPAGFWEALGELERAEVQALRDGGAGAQERLEKAHARLVSLEASLGPAWQPLPGGLLERTRRALPANTAWFSFHLGDADSWVWAVDQNGLELYRLPARDRIEELVTVAATAIREDSVSADAAGAALYGTLFGAVAPRFRGKARWLLALDQKLFEVPMAALREQPGGPYVAERHITQVLPGVGYWLDAADRRRAPASPGLFVGVGDPIYNTADERLKKLPDLRQASLFPFPMAGKAAAEQKPTLMLPRLVASATELDACARAWQGERVLLEGSRASRREVAAQIERGPAVVHFATHFLEYPGKQADSMIALGLDRANDLDLLTPEEIAHRTVRAGLVVLSGCHSAAGAVFPGTGLVGLTRAFLAAGAGAVVSSRWATPDDDGRLFAAFYAALGSRTPADAGGALREAQLSMIRSGGRRARPAYWGAYFLVGNL